MPELTNKTILTVGAVKLSALGKKHGFVTIARTVKKTEGTVRHHSTGRRLPDDAVQKLYADVYGIRTADWSRAAEIPDVPKAVQPVQDGTASKGEPVQESVQTALETVRANLSEIDQAITEAKGDEATSAAHLATLFNAKSRASQLLARLTGALDVSEAVLLSSPAWARLRVFLMDALRQHPDAAKSVADAITAFTESQN